MDVAIGLAAPLVVLLLEKKEYAHSHQYDVKRLVPALTRCSHGLIIMWYPKSFDRVPWDQLPKRDGTEQIYDRMCRRFPFVEEPKEVADWFLRGDVRNAILRRKEDDPASRAAGYEELRTEAAGKDFGPSDEDDSDGGHDDELEMKAGPVDDEAQAKVKEKEGEAMEEVEPDVDPDTLARFQKVSTLLTQFVASEISCMVIEARGQQHFAFPENKWFPKSVFQDLQHNEKGCDQGNKTYGKIYDLWKAEMQKRFPQVVIPVDCSNKSLCL